MKQFLKSLDLPLKHQTLKWKSGDTEKTYLEQIKKGNSLYGVNDIEYKHNNYGFRCDNFEDWQKHKYRILFAGCSAAEGIALPLDQTWTKLVHSKICSELNTQIPFWSIAQAATSLDHIVRYFYHLGDLLRPQVIITYIPFIERRERWNDDTWIPNQGNGNFFKPSYFEENKVFYDQNFIDYQTEKNMAMLQLMLEKWNSIMLCASLNREYDPNYEYLDRIHNDKSLYLVKTDFGRDGYHGGPKSNKEFADQVFDSMWPKIKDIIELTKTK